MTTQPDQPHATHEQLGVRQPSNSLAIASLVLGIVGIVAAILIAIVGGVVGIVAVVLGIVARRRPGLRGLALGGIITGAVAIVIAAINSVLGAMLMSGQL